MVFVQHEESDIKIIHDFAGQNSRRIYKNCFFEMYERKCLAKYLTTHWALKSEYIHNIWQLRECLRDNRVRKHVHTAYSARLAYSFACRSYRGIGWCFLTLYMTNRDYDCLRHKLFTKIALFSLQVEKAYYSWRSACNGNAKMNSKHFILSAMAAVVMAVSINSKRLKKIEIIKRTLLVLEITFQK